VIYCVQMQRQVICLRILFCDDNCEILNQLQEYVLEFFSELGGTKPECASYSCGEALLAVERYADIAFLDVEMPGISGIQVGAKLKKLNPNIKIFIVTSYPDYLDDAMRFQVFRYLSKPIDKLRLFRNLKDAVYQHSMDSKEYPIVTADGIAVRRAEEIVCVEAVARKVLIHTTDTVFQSTSNMDYWRKTLTLPCFCSTHRSYVINMRYVNMVFKDKILLKYGDMCKEAYLTRRKYTAFKDTYLLYLESVK